MSVGQGYDGQMRPFAVMKTIASFTPNLNAVPQFRQAVSNRYGLWDITRQRMICQVPGSYRVEINSAMTGTPISTDLFVSLGIFVNGNLYDTLRASITAENASSAGIFSAATIVPLDVNDALTISSTIASGNVFMESGARLIISYADILTRA